MSKSFKPGEKDALIVVDVQNDFCAGGALAVPDGDAVVAPINKLMDHFGTIILTQDWHPAGHHSFASSHQDQEPMSVIEAPYGKQILWPDHCMQGSAGAEFHRDLRIDPAHLVIRKGFRKHIDSYSAFYENDRKTPTGLAGYLRERHIARLFFVGLALDFCVGWSAEDAVKEGFDSVVLEDACRAIDADGSLDAMLETFGKVGVTPAKTGAILDGVDRS